MAEPIQTVVLAGFTAAIEPQTVGEIAARACLADLCQTWNAMLDTGMSVTGERIQSDVDAVIEILQRFKCHTTQAMRPRLKVLKGEKPAE